MTRLLLAASAAAFSLATQAQPTSAVQGQWTGVTKSPSTGQELQVQVLIRPDGGTWKYSTHTPAKRAGPCLERELPLHARSLSATQLVLVVEGSKVMTGCPDFKLTLEQLDDSTLAGQFVDGRPLRLQR
jgi:hypothetical protein